MKYLVEIMYDNLEMTDVCTDIKLIDCNNIEKLKVDLKEMLQEYYKPYVTCYKLKDISESVGKKFTKLDDSKSVFEKQY